MHVTTLCLCIFLVHKTVWGIHFSFERDFDESSVSLEPQIVVKPFEAPLFSNESSEIDSARTDRTEEGNTEYKQVFTTDNTSLTDEANFTLPSSNQSLPSTYSTSGVPSTSSIDNMGTSTAVFSNESHSQSSTEFSSSESSAATNKGTTSGIKSSNVTTPSNNERHATTDDDEPEGVARGKPNITESVTTTTEKPQTFIGKTLSLVFGSDDLSDGILLYGFLVPLFAGVSFTVTIILTIIICRRTRGMCKSRRLRQKKLPKSVKNFRQPDRARLLAESSDEEF